MYIVWHISRNEFICLRNVRREFILLYTLDTRWLIQPVINNRRGIASVLTAHSWRKYKDGENQRTNEGMSTKFQWHFNPPYTQLEVTIHKILITFIVLVVELATTGTAGIETAPKPHDSMRWEEDRGENKKRWKEKRGKASFFDLANLQ